MARRKKQQPEDPIRTVTKLGTVENNAAGAHLFGALLRGIEMAKKRIAKEKEERDASTSAAKAAEAKVRP